MDSISTNQMHHILVAHVVNNIVSTSHIKNDAVDCELTKFLSTLNKLLKDYQKTFDLDDKLEMIGSDNLRTIISESDFKHILNIHEDSVKIDATPHKFQTTLSNILVNTALSYSDTLTLEVNQLTEKYHNTDENAMEEPTEPPQTEVKPEVVTSEVPAEDKMEVDESPQVEQAPESTTEALAGNGQNKEVEKLADPAEEVNTTKFEEKLIQDAATTAPIETNREPAPTAPEKQEDNEEESAGGDDAKEPEEQEQPEASTEAEAVTEAYEQVHVDDKVEEEERKEEEKSPEVEAEGDKSEAPKVKEPSPAVATPEPPQDENTGEEHEATPKRSELIKEESRKRSLSPLAASQKHKRFQNIAVNLVKTIEEHRFSSPFLTPVNAKEYEQVIYEPKDLKSILKAIRQKDVQAYETVKELERDIMLMFANCVMYNKSNTHLVEMAIQMKNDVRKTFKMFEDAESGI